MPSIQDVADQINAKLDQITQNTADSVTVAQNIKNELIQANTRLSTIDADLKIGFANLSQGLFAITELQKVEIALLDRNREQNDTIICLLENSNQLLCGITRKLTEELELSKARLRAARRTEGILERAHAAEAADYDRLAALHAEIEKCCPPDEKPPEPCPEPCAKADFRPTKPKGQDWKPLPTPAEPKPDPIG